MFCFLSLVLRLRLWSFALKVLLHLWAKAIPLTYSVFFFSPYFSNENMKLSMFECMFLNRILMGYNFSFCFHFMLVIVSGWNLTLSWNFRKILKNSTPFGHFGPLLAWRQNEWHLFQLSMAVDTTVGRTKPEGTVSETQFCWFWLFVDKWTPEEDWKLKPASSNCSHQSLWCPLGVNKQPGHLIHRPCLRVCGQRAWRVCQGEIQRWQAFLPPRGHCRNEDKILSLPQQ